MTLYVKRISGTLQGGLDVELGPKTLLVGINGSGKSRVRRAVELAITGSASDVMGRDEVASGTELLQLATPGSDLIADAVLSDGTQAKFHIKREVKGKGAKQKVSSSTVEPLRPPSVDPKTAMPLWMLKENILGKAGNARRFFLSHTASKVLRSDVLTLLPGMLHDKYVRAIEASGIKSVEPEIDKLLAAMEYAAKQGGEAVRDSNKTKAQVAELGNGLPPPPTAAEEETAQRTLAEARTAVEQAVNGFAQKTQRSSLEDRARGVNEQIQMAAARGAQANQQLIAINQAAAALPTLAEARAKIQTMPPLQLAMINAVLELAKYEQTATTRVDAQCYCCGSAVPFGHFTARAAAAQQALDVHNETQKQAREYLAWAEQQHARKEEYLTLANHEIAEAQKSIDGLTIALGQLNAQIAVTPGEDAGAPVLTIESAREVQVAAEAMLRRQGEAKAAWESTYRARDAAAKAETDANEWKQLAAACGDVVRDLLDKGVAAFVARVQAYLPATDKFGMRLRDGAREVCQWGLFRGENLFTALSGAEWARVTAALAAVCGPVSEDKLAVVCPHQLGERAFDADTLTAVMRALAAIPQQVILESPSMPTTVPQGWKVVQVGPLAGEKQEPAQANGKSNPFEVGPGVSVKPVLGQLVK